jgi:RND family efflux transporter MFP subunit
MSYSEKTPTSKKIAQIGVTTIAMALVLVWMEGGFEHKTAPGMSGAVAAERPATGMTARVERRETEELFNWPATVAALTVTQVAPKMPGRILDITVRAGNPVKRDQVLVRLNATENRARLEQARSALVAAEAEAHRARIDAVRIQNLFDREAATRRDLDSVLAATRAADALAVQAREAVREAQSHLNDAVLTAPFDSVVVSRNQEPGDMALPGVPVITLQQSQHLRIEAAIPVTCSDRIALGNVLMARIGTPAREIRVTVDEIQPLADAQTRTVLIKARLPANSGTQPGAFAWLQQACGHESVLLVPAGAVTRIGQLESVHLITDGQTKLRHVRTGKRLGDAVEILSGLSEGDTVQIAGDR